MQEFIKKIMDKAQENMTQEEINSLLLESVYSLHQQVNTLTEIVNEMNEEIEEDKYAS